MDKNEKSEKNTYSGLHALGRVGASFTEDQIEMIRLLVEAGDIAEAQRTFLNCYRKS